MDRILKDVAGVEPTAMKIMAGVILLAIGLGIGVAVYRSIRMPSFSIDLSPTSATVSPENYKDVQVTVRRLFDYDKVVTLGAITPDNVTVNFSPSSGTPEFGSTMRINVGVNASSGTITVKGTGIDGSTASATFQLTVA